MPKIIKKFLKHPVWAWKVLGSCRSFIWSFFYMLILLQEFLNCIVLCVANAHYIFSAWVWCFTWVYEQFQNLWNKKLYCIFAICVFFDAIWFWGQMKTKFEELNSCKLFQVKFYIISKALSKNSLQMLSEKKFQKQARERSRSSVISSLPEEIQEADKKVTLLFAWFLKQFSASSFSFLHF